MVTQRPFLQIHSLFGYKLGEIKINEWLQTNWFESESKLWSTRSWEVHGLQFPVFPGSGTGQPCSRVVTKPWVWNSGKWVRLEIWWSQTSVTQFSPRVILLWFSHWLCMLLGASEQKGLPPSQLCLPLPSGLCWNRLEAISHLPTLISGQGDGVWGPKVASSPDLLISSCTCVRVRTYACAHTHTKV